MCGTDSLFIVRKDSAIKISSADWPRFRKRQLLVLNLSTAPNLLTVDPIKSQALYYCLRLGYTCNFQVNKFCISMV